MILGTRNKSFILIGNVSYINETFHISRKKIGDNQGV